MKRLLLALVGLTAGTTLFRAAPGIPWRAATYSTQADRVPASALLQAFATQQGLPLQLNAPAEAPVSGRFQDLPARQFLDAVCEATGLLWFWDGSRLHIDAAAASETRVINLEAVTPERATAALRGLGFDGGPATLGQAVRGGDGILTVAGSRKFIEVAEPVLKTLNSMEAERASQARLQTDREEAAAAAAGAQVQIRVFRLTYATAGDITVRGGSSQSVIPGVARALQNIMGTSSGELSVGVESTPGRNQLTGLRGTGLAAAGKETAPKAAAMAPVRRDELPADENRVLIQADPRLNAVIIRDTVARLPLYEELIRQLDVPSPVIEISAAVVDIDTDNNRNAGVEFLSFGRVGNGITPRAGFDGDFGASREQGGTTTSGTLTDSQALIRTSGFASSVLVPVSGFELLARVRALEEKGEAQLVTSPTVITLDNVEANLRQDDTVYVRVSGNGTGASSDLFNVRTGVSLRVTPTVVREGDELSFRMVVEVQDGAFSDLTVDGVPATRESTISTQAVVPANRTLLIGGYFVERRSDKTHQIPGLGDLPYVGGLFKRSDRTQARAQRFFFITPRLVDVKREARTNLPAAPAEKNRLPAASSDPAKVRDRADAAIGRSLGAFEPAPTTVLETAPAKP